MWRWTKRIVTALIVVVVIAALAGIAYERISTRYDLAANPAPGSLLDVGGHRLHIWCTGSGEPTVILETGLGGSGTVDWSYVRPEIAKFTRVCSYDRAGMGYSEPGPSPRTARRIAAELAEVLDRSGISGPVVVVGASIGGLFMRVFAATHSERVAGLVLVDASHEDQEVTVPRIAPLVPLLSSVGVFRLLGFALGGPTEGLPPSAQRFARATRFRASAYQTAANELTHLRETAAEVRATRRQLSVPVVVVTAGLGTDEEWQRLQRDQVGLSARGCQVTAEQSGHAIAVGQPQAIVKPIRAIVDAARGRSDASICGNE